MNYQSYGIRPELVARVKLKMKNPVVKEQVKHLLNGVTKAHLQDRQTVKRLVRAAAQLLHEPLTEEQHNQLVNFVLAQKIDPNNTFHLLKLWGMFR